MGTTFLHVPQCANTLIAPTVIKSTWKLLQEHQITLASDLVDGSGLTLLEEAWNERSAHIQHRQHTWPNQGNPPLSARETWRAYVKKCFLGRGLRQKRPLGTGWY